MKTTHVILLTSLCMHVYVMHTSLRAKNGNNCVYSIAFEILQYAAIICNWKLYAVALLLNKMLSTSVKIIKQ